MWTVWLWFQEIGQLLKYKFLWGRNIPRATSPGLKQPTNADFTLKYWYRKIFQQNLQIFVGNNHGIGQFSLMRNFEKHDWVKFGFHVKAKLKSPTGTSKLHTTPHHTTHHTTRLWRCSPIQKVSVYELDSRDLILDRCVGILSHNRIQKWVSSHKKSTMQQLLGTLAISKGGKNVSHKCNLSFETLYIRQRTSPSASHNTLHNTRMWNSAV